MRFTKNKKLKIAYTESFTKYKQKFLWFPLTINGETRWLEKAHIAYRVNWKYDLFCNKYYYWEALEFLNK